MQRKIFLLLLISSLAPLAPASAQEWTPGQRIVPRLSDPYDGPRLPLREWFIAAGTMSGDGKLDSYNSGNVTFYGARVGGYFSLANNFFASYLGMFDRGSNFRIADYLRLELQTGPREFDRAAGGPLGSVAGKTSSSWTTWRLGVGVQFNWLLSPALEVGGLISANLDSKALWHENQSGLSGKLYGTRVRYDRFAAELQTIRNVIGGPDGTTTDLYRMLRLRYYRPTGKFIGVDIEREGKYLDNVGWLFPKGDPERKAGGIRLLIGIHH